MKKILLTLLLLSPVTLNAADQQILINQNQIDKLDIVVGPLSVSHQVPILSAPAKVVVPANHERLLSSTQPGLIVQLLANIGDSIQKDQVLAVINSPELVTLQRDYLTAQSDLKLSDLEYSRDQKLLEEGVIADRRWHETETLHLNKTAHSDSARQLLEMAGMSSVEIQDLVHTGKLNSLLLLRSPISGVVLERFATVGSRLNIQEAIYRIADLTQLWLEINIPQERVRNIAIGDRVHIENTDISAKISLLGQSVINNNQTVLARAVIEGHTDILRAGQNINVQIMENSTENNFKVPNSAIAQYAGHNYIFVRNTNGFYVTEIDVTGKQDSDSLISGPFSGHELIAVKGSVALKAAWLGLGSSD